MAAVVYGDFLNRFNDVRDKYFPDEAVKDRRDFHVAALARTNAIRTNSEKGWENVHEDSLTDNAGYVPGVDGVVKSDVSLHIGPEEQDLAGIVVDMIRSGTVVNVAKGQPLKVNGVEYVKVQVLDNKHKVVNEGWVAANSITRKFGTKPGKSLEHNGTTTV